METEIRAAIFRIVGALALAALTAPAMAQEIPVVPVDADHIRIGNLTYDIRTGSSSDGIVLRGPSPAGQEFVREVIAAGCLRPDEADLSRHDCYMTGIWFTAPLETVTDGPKCNRSMPRWNL
jgi:hypothetical protein